MTRVQHTFTPEEEAAFVANPTAFANLPAAFQPLKPDDHFIVPHCGLLGCDEEATETGRCVRHEAIWQRLHA